MDAADTIAAISSAVGPAARMIVRVSGERAKEIAQSVASAARLEHASAVRETISVAGLSLPVCIYAFHAPRSYTGEDLLEFHLPGNPLLARMVLVECLRRGARLAEPGEFTARAYFNGRLDLAAAEGVAATVAAQNEAELQAARQLLAGELARRLRPVMHRLTHTLALVETGIDFSDEDVTFIATGDLESRIRNVDAELAELLGNTARFERLAHEPQIVLIGRPNAGKSTLLNALAGRDRAVVSPVAGTTRDVISADVRLARGIVKLLDVAGLENYARDEVQSDPEAHIARQMRERALQTVETADLIVHVRDPHDPIELPDLPRPPDLIVRTKLDLADSAGVSSSIDDVSVSAHTGANLDVLRERLDVLAFGAEAQRPSLALNARHLAAIADARHALGRARANATSGAEIIALDLREALDALGAILGQVSPDDVLGQVFATFCIGK
ncbi:MAG TPA: tRNA modification GTPase [Tepidisphaeraceae bacterium]|nr:tRNA modification GTPase [Tepidisphaeraceae bacterium]